MKKLFLIRHAKSDWSNEQLRDFNRPLNHRGKKNVSLIAKILKNKSVHPNLIISSPACRAKETTRQIMKKIAFDEVVYEKCLYEASLANTLEIIKLIPDEHNEVFIIGHNPSLNMLAFYLLEFNRNFPTCGVLEMTFETNTWKGIDKTNGKLISFEYPKKYCQKKSM